DRRPDAMRQSVVARHRKTLAETFLRAHEQCVIASSSAIVPLADIREFRPFNRIKQSQDAAAIGIGSGRTSSVRCCVEDVPLSKALSVGICIPRKVNRRIQFGGTVQMDDFVSNVARCDQPILTNLSLDPEVPLLDVRGMCVVVK